MSYSSVVGFSGGSLVGWLVGCGFEVRLEATFYFIFVEFPRSQLHGCRSCFSLSGVYVYVEESKKRSKTPKYLSIIQI